jgi:hypothetical protein
MRLFMLNVGFCDVIKFISYREALDIEAYSSDWVKIKFLL